MHPDKKSIRALYFVISGVLMGACMTFPTAAGAVLQWLAFVPAALALYSLADGERPKYRRVYGWGLLFFMAEYLVVYHWFTSMYPLDFTGMSKGYAVAVVILGCVGMSLLAAVAGGFVFVLFVLLSRLEVVKEHNILRPLIAAMLYSVFEWTMTLGWTGVPWGRLALGQLVGNFTVTVLPASVLGSYFITFLMVFASFLVALGLYEGKIKLYATLALCVAAADLLMGTVILFLPVSATNAGQNGGEISGENKDSGENVKTVTLSAVQGNISSREKWDVNASELTLERYYEYSKKAAEQGADIILWPETAFPYNVGEGGINEKVLAEMSRELGAALFVGCFDSTEMKEQQNIIRCFRPDGDVTGKYVKRRLVPFGEFLPYRGLFEILIPPLTELSMLSEDLSAGTEATVITAKNSEGRQIRYGVMICFDSIYEELARASVKNGADVLLLGTNDSWFEDSRALWMHEGQARLRAIENARPVVRAANTGVSSLIDEKGRVKDRVEPLVEGMIVREISVPDVTTPYTLVGNLLIWICIVSMVLLPVAEILKKYKKQKTKNET